MTNQPQINKRIEELRKQEKTFILFNDRYLLEGNQVALSRNKDDMTYFGERFTDYGVEPPKVIELKDCITTSDLEKLFEVSEV